MKTLITTFIIFFFAPLLSFGQSVDIVWEANSYTPPLYRGKALYPKQGDLRATALPNGFGVNSSNINYTWKVDGVVLGSLSGRGRQTLFVEGKVVGRAPLLEVTAESGSREASAIEQVPTSNPFVRFYERDALLGVRFESPLRGRFNLENDEITLEAYPFYFSGNKTNSKRFSWNMNGRNVPPTGGVGTLTLRAPEESGGQASIGIEVIHMQDILQNAKESLTILFGES